MSKRAVFVDRDGTLIEDVGFVRRVEDVKLMPQAAAAVAKLNEAGWSVVVVTNQSGVARGLLTERDVAATNQRMMDLLKRQHARVDAIYYCPHLPEGKVADYTVVCNCRKPRPGMILQAAQDLDIDLAQSVTIGDAPRDVEAGLSAGTRAILLTQSATRADRVPDACGQAPDLMSAVGEILQFADAAQPPPAVNAASDADVAQPPSAGVASPASPQAEGPATNKAKTQPRAAEPHQQAPAAPAEEVREIPVQAALKEFVPEPEEKAPEPPAVESVEPTPPVAQDSQSDSPRLVGAPHPQEPAAAEPARTCGRCGREVRSADLDAGRAFGREGVYLCGLCAAAVASRRIRPATEGAGEGNAGKGPSDAGLLREVQNIARALTFKHQSPWHVLGAVVQALAVGSVIMGYASHAGQEGLLWAIFLQLVALTMFVLGRM